MARIIAGTAGGRRIEVPKGDLTRPTSDRVREALFSGLDARQVLRGAKVLDLFAGSGALGLEAASRGAGEVVLVDSARGAAAVARRNATVLGLSAVRVVLASVQRFLAGNPPFLAGSPADVVFIDPPYALGQGELGEILEAVATRWLAPDGLIVVERSARSPEPRWPDRLGRSDVRRHGETALWFAVLLPEESG